jgi:hypothetical protein
MNTPKRKTKANHLTFLHGLDPQRSFTPASANGGFRIAKQMGWMAPAPGI